MQSRRKEDCTAAFPSSKLRKQLRIEMGRDRYPVSRRIDARDKSPRSRRSLSPCKFDGSGRGLVVGRRNASPDGREYGLHFGGGRNIRNMSRSPPYGQMRKRSYFDLDEGPAQRKYEYVEPMDFNDGSNSTSRHVYEQNHGLPRINKEKDYNETNIAGIEKHEMFDGNLICIEGGRGSRHMPPDMGPTSNYRQAAGHVPSLSKSTDIACTEHGELSYPETMQLDKVVMRESYREEDKHTHGLRDVPYTMVQAPHSKDFVSNPRYSNTVDSSSGLSRSEALVSYGDGTHKAASDEYPRNFGKLSGPTSFNTYIQGRRQDPVRNYVGTSRSLTLYQHGAYSPSRAEHEEYLYGEQEETMKNDLLYQSGGLQRMPPSRDQGDYNHTPVSYDHRNLSRSSVIHPVIDRFHKNKDSCENIIMNSVSDFPALRKEVVPDYHEFNTSYPLKQGGDYLGSGCSHVDLGRKIAQDSKISHLDPLEDHHASHSRSDLGFHREAGQEFHKDGSQGSPFSRYEQDMQEFGLKMDRMAREHEIYEPSDRILKRKYNMEDGIGRHNSKTIMYSKWNEVEEYEDLYDSEEDLIDGDMMGLFQPESRRVNRNENRKSGRIYNWQNHSGDRASDDWLSPQDSLSLRQGPSERFYKQSGRYIKGHQRPGSLRWRNSRHTDKRSDLHKYNKVWKRNNDYNEDVHDDDAITSEDWMNLDESNAYEDSEEFKQLIHEAFLKYTKKLNVNASVRRRYKEQGRAGSLFCIVCGRSASKEFMDTQRLVTHAFMSHKGGLRARHLGLHKAICVLLGWNCVVPHDTITWVPQVLSDAEALAAKEDLILWPPIVVIHNVSMSKNIPMEQNVIPVEGIEAFLRGKGFVGGKVSLLRPSDQSRMVVRFLGTFTGLANAERLHKYFAERKHGRLELNRTTLSNCKINFTVDTGKTGENLEEHLLYGYMGIAEDLDGVDFNTKKWSLVKSKKEIQDLANAPVKTDDR